MRKSIMIVYLSLVFIVGTAAAAKADRLYSANDLVGNQENYAKLTDTDKSEITLKMAKAHMPFIVNTGQTDEKVAFYARTFGGMVFVTKDGELVYSLPKVEEEEMVMGVALKEEFVGGRVQDVTGEGQATTRVSYFKGKDPSTWRSNIPTYELVSLGGVYQGIDVKLKAYGNNVEKLFFVQPGAQPETIQVKLNGIQGLNVNDAGELEVETELGVITFTKPVAYQEESGKKKYVEIAYTVKDDEYGFSVGEYNRETALVIDPLLASTLLGGNKQDGARSITIDQSGNVYVTGPVISSDFPTTSGAYAQSANNWDVFISKLDNKLTTLMASTFLGGSHYYELGYSITIDQSGNVYVAGYTRSSDFPTTLDAYDESFNGGDCDVFVARLNSDLTTLLASTFLGGGNHDYGNSLTLDQSGNVYVGGYTGSPDFPTTSDAYNQSHSGGEDVFVSKLDRDLTTLITSTFLGGNGGDWGYAIGLDQNGNVYVAGGTWSSDFPTTSGAYDQTQNGGGGIFISRFDNDLTALLASTFFGGNNHYENADSITIDQSGDVYVTGYTQSSDFPTTPGVYDQSHSGGEDAFVSRFDSDLTTLIASTFLGGSGRDRGYSITLNQSGSIYVAGQTSSSNFPTTPGAYDQYFNGISNTFISRLDSDLITLLTSTFLGSGHDNGYSLVLDQNGNVYVAGETYSSIFPTTSGAYDNSYNGGGDVFVSKLDSDLSATFPTYRLTVQKNGTGIGTVTGDGIDCGANCDEVYDLGTIVTLTAIPDPGSVFSGWSGDCSGTNQQTTVIMEADKSCIATFSPPNPVAFYYEAMVHPGDPILWQGENLREDPRVGDNPYWLSGKFGWDTASADGDVWLSRVGGFPIFEMEDLWYQDATILNNFPDDDWMRYVDVAEIDAYFGPSEVDLLGWIDFELKYRDDVWSSSSLPMDLSMDGLLVGQIKIGTFDDLNYVHAEITNLQDYIIPEPTTVVLLGSGILILAGLRKLRRTAK